MNEKYDHKKIEEKWQKKWQEDGLYKTSEKLNGPKVYVLDMFPYPSGDGLHVGHPKGYIATDIYSRMKKMQGFNILHPMGFDAFGLPAENFAIKNKIHPKIAVEKNVKRFKEQLQKIGFNYDWEREVNTTDPGFYKWTEWIFLKLLEKGLAYESFEPINWCPSCQTGLANEDLENGKCERCGSVVEKKPMRQWVLKITDYADRLLYGLDDLNWPEYIKESQRNWIGKSEGTIIEFSILNFQFSIPVFTTRADTLFGATYLVLAPEHPMIENLKFKIENWNEVEKYIKEVRDKTEIERTSESREKTGVKLDGVTAINPATGEEIPIWIADYVLGNYGTGAIMAVPAHDERDFEFAKKYNLPIKPVIGDRNIFNAQLENLIKAREMTSELCDELGSYEEWILRKGSYVGEGILINSEEFEGMKSEEARGKITEKFGERVIKYKLRDWVFSRQRYWGEPIPVVHCEKCGVVPVQEKDLPVKLPEVLHYEPTGTGESPLATIEEWVNTSCPKCGGFAKRETNTMPQWAGSSWYYLRYIDPKNSDKLVDKEKEKYWDPVDVYVGGAEHATRHLIYARFWHKFLFDIGVVNYEEPFARLHNVGLILAEDGKKMSKRYGNVVNPDDVVETWGADTLRLYEMFMGPFNQEISWSTDNMIGPRRFLEKVWRLSEKRKAKSEKENTEENKKLESLLYKTIKKVTEDIESFDFNTAISAMMIFINELDHTENVPKGTFDAFLKILAPFAPHMIEEIWHDLGNQKSIHLEEWPKYDASKIADEKVTIVVQINGKVRSSFEAETGISESEATNKALLMPDVQKWIEKSEIKKIIFVPNKILNLVV